MFQIGDHIIYGSTGVCQVQEIGVPENFSGADPTRTYYTLKPIYDVGCIYTPIDTSVYMRAVISKAQVQGLLENLPTLEVDPFDSRNVKMLSDHYLEAIQSHDCEQLLRLIKTMDVKAKAAAKNGKRPGQTDQRYMKRAEDLLYGEFAVSLGVSMQAVAEQVAAALYES